MTCVATAPVAAGSLVAGYAVARGTGVRPLGGVVFAAGTVWCARRWSGRHGALATVALTATQLGAFALSHRLARRIGAWPGVAVSAGVAGVVAAAADVLQAEVSPAQPAARGLM